MKRSTLFTGLILLAAASFEASAAGAERPNVLIIVADDLGFSDLGCYGGEIPTPNIDALATNGLRFTRFSNSARCCPSRASLLTGLHPAQAGIPNFAGSLNDQCVTFAEVLGGAGYSTYAVGKWHVGLGKALPTARGFAEFYGYPGGHSQDQWTPGNYQRLPADRAPEVAIDPDKFYATDAFTDYALEFIRQGETSKKPWLLYLAHSSPHFPLQAPAESVKPFLETYRRGWDVLREERFTRMKKIGLANHDGWSLSERSMVPLEENNAIANGYSGKQNPAWDSLPADRREDLAHRMAIYAAMVRHVDEGVGRIVAHLKSSGQFDNTLILFTSDNGACYEWGPFGFDGKSRTGNTTLHQGAALESMGGPDTHMAYGSAWANLCNTPFRNYKHHTHQGGIVSPLVVHWPAGVRSPGRWVKDPAHVMDVMPTLVSVTGATYPAERNGKRIQPVEGTSLAPTFQPGTDLPPRSIATQHEGSRAITRGDWKLVWADGLAENPVWELYHLTRDPCEINDLAPSNPDLVKSLSAEWNQWATRTGLANLKKRKNRNPNP